VRISLGDREQIPPQDFQCRQFYVCQRHFKAGERIAAEERKKEKEIQAKQAYESSSLEDKINTLVQISNESLKEGRLISSPCTKVKCNVKADARELVLRVANNVYITTGPKEVRIDYIEEDNNKFFDRVKLTTRHFWKAA
jgi:hypothetical protein